MALSVNESKAAPSRRDVWRMFDRIASRYDLLNRVLSGRQDVVWRRRVASLVEVTEAAALDLATGTADQLIALADSGRVTSGVGIDLANLMLDRGRSKLAARGLDSEFRLEHGSAEEIPFDAATFDVAAMSFGIRNVTDVPKTLTEIYRVLRPGGQVLILEFSLPANRLVRSLYLFYFRHVLPRLGAVVSGDANAYRYLNETVETFPYGNAFCQLLREAGFAQVTAHPLTFGIASIYTGRVSS